MSSGPKQQRKGHRKPSRRSIRIHRNYTVEEAARTTGCAKGTIRRWIRSLTPSGGSAWDEYDRIVHGGGAHG
jgi:hypothetical protein